MSLQFLQLVKVSAKPGARAVWVTGDAVLARKPRFEIGTGVGKRATTTSNGCLIFGPLEEGTYTVNADCTGSAIVTIPGVPLSPVSFHFVIVDGGKQVRQVVDANAVIATGNRID